MAFLYICIILQQNCTELHFQCLDLQFNIKLIIETQSEKSKLELSYVSLEALMR